MANQCRNKLKFGTMWKRLNRSCVEEQRLNSTVPGHHRTWLMKLNSSSMGLNDGEPCSPRLLETHTLLVEPPPSWSDSRRHSRVNERAISLPSSTTHDVRCTPA